MSFYYVILNLFCFLYDIISILQLEVCPVLGLVFSSVFLWWVHKYEYTYSTSAISSLFAMCIQTTVIDNFKIDEVTLML